MSGIWNFLYSFTLDKSLSNYSTDELCTKLKEIDLDKHLDSLEKAFEVQSLIIDRLRNENAQLKKELREIKARHNESLDEFPIRMIYPELKIVKCNVMWSSLQNNAVESRIINIIQTRLVDFELQFEMQPWRSDSSESSVHPLIVFINAVVQKKDSTSGVGATVLPLSTSSTAPTGFDLSIESFIKEIEKLMPMIREKTHKPCAIVIIHETLELNMKTAHFQNAADRIANLIKNSNVIDVLHLTHFDTVLANNSQNEAAFEKLIKMLK